METLVVAAMFGGVAMQQDESTQMLLSFSVRLYVDKTRNAYCGSAFINQYNPTLQVSSLNYATGGMPRALPLCLSYLLSPNQSGPRQNFPRKFFTT